MITAKIKIKEGTKKLGVSWTVAGLDTATDMEKAEYQMICMALRDHVDFLASLKPEGFASVMGASPEAKKVIKNRFESL